MKKLNKNTHESPYAGRREWSETELATDTKSDTYGDERRKASSWTLKGVFLGQERRCLERWRAWSPTLKGMGRIWEGRKYLTKGERERGGKGAEYEVVPRRTRPKETRNGTKGTKEQAKRNKQTKRRKQRSRPKETE